MKYFIVSHVNQNYSEPPFDPESFTTEELWKVRENVDTSVAVKCPSIQYHLMTNKVKINKESK